MSLSKHGKPRKAGAERRAVTILELLVVVLILGILSTIAAGVYIGQTNRAKIAATQDTLREITIAATRYNLDTGQWPLSGSGTVTPGNPPTVSNRVREGNGLLYLSLVHSLSGNSFVPFPTTWGGPYIEFRSSQLAYSDTLGMTQILDVYASAYQYVNSDEYDTAPFQGTELFSGGYPAGFDIQLELPANNVFFATETYYNPRTFQIYSRGPNAVTVTDPYGGTERDDINNYSY